MTLDETNNGNTRLCDTLPEYHRKWQPIKVEPSSSIESVLSLTEILLMSTISGCHYSSLRCERVWAVRADFLRGAHSTKLWGLDSHPSPFAASKPVQSQWKHLRYWRFLARASLPRPMGSHDCLYQTKQLVEVEFNGPCTVLQFVGVQVDVTSRTEGTATGDAAGVPLLVKYDTRLREKGKDNVANITAAVQVRGFRALECPSALNPVYGRQMQQGRLCRCVYAGRLDVLMP